MNFIFSFELFEDASAAAPSAGVATATQGNASGMGNVVSAQPSSQPGALMTGNGTSGSGDYGMALKTYTKGDGITGNMYTKTGSNNRIKKDLKNFINGIKGKERAGKVMNFEDFNKDETKKVTKVEDLK